MQLLPELLPVLSSRLVLRALHLQAPRRSPSKIKVPGRSNRTCKRRSVGVTAATEVPACMAGATGLVSTAGATGRACVAGDTSRAYAFTAGATGPASMVGGAGVDTDLGSTAGAGADIELVFTDLAFMAGAGVATELVFTGRESTAGADVDMGPAFTVGGAGADRAFMEPALFIAALAFIAAGAAAKR